MSNNFTFTTDPLLGNNMSTEDTWKQLEMYKNKLVEKQEQLKPVAPDTLWEDLDREFSSLTDEQKHILLDKDEFKESQHEVDMMTQSVLASILRPYILQSPDARSAVEKQLDTIKTLKKQVVKESNKQNEMFKEYTEKYSNISWSEYIKMKQAV